MRLQANLICSCLNTVLTVISLIFVRSEPKTAGCCLNTVLTVISLIEILPVSGKSEKSLNTVLTVISLIKSEKMPRHLRRSQYRSHGYLFNQKFEGWNGGSGCLNTVLTVISLILLCTVVFGAMFSLNTVLTVISLIALNGVFNNTTAQSQYRSHGYLFNQNENVSVKAKNQVSIPFSRLSL